MCADPGAAGDQEREDDQTLIISRKLEVMVEQRIGAGFVSVAHKVHQQKGQIVEHIDAGEVVVELDGIE